MTSHQRQLATHPTTVTDVPLKSQVAVGKLFSGPARTLTEVVVIAVWAAASGMQEATATASKSCRRLRMYILSVVDSMVSLVLPATGAMIALVIGQCFHGEPS